MTIRAFRMPTSDPFGMLSGYKDAAVKEKVLRWFLEKSIQFGDFAVRISSREDYSEIVKDGLLQEKVRGEYSLTSKSISLLYPFYKKEW
jgi:hypothetical protein